MFEIEKFSGSQSRNTSARNHVKFQFIKMIQTQIFKLHD